MDCDTKERLNSNTGSHAGALQPFQQPRILRQCVVEHSVRMPHVVWGLVLAFEFMYTSAYIFIRNNDAAFALNAYQASSKLLSSEK